MQTNSAARLRGQYVDLGTVQSGYDKASLPAQKQLQLIQPPPWQLWSKGALSRGGRRHTCKPHLFRKIHWDRRLVRQRDGILVVHFKKTLRCHVWQVRLAASETQVLVNHHLTHLRAETREASHCIPTAKKKCRLWFRISGSCA